MTSNELFWTLLRDVGCPLLFGLYVYIMGMSRNRIDLLGITLFFAGGFHLWRGVYSDVYFYSSLSCLGAGLALFCLSFFYRKPVPAPVEAKNERPK